MGIAANGNKTVYETQQLLTQLGFNCGEPDGLWGKLSTAALEACKSSLHSPQAPYGTKLVTWGQKLTDAEIARVAKMVTNLGLPYTCLNDFMACMAFETGGTFSPSIKNGAGAPYYGLIQFGAAAASDVGTTLDALVKMTVLQQLDYVEKFFKPYAGKIRDLSDLYSRIIWPAAVGKPADYVIFVGGTTAYLQNKGLDINFDGKVTKLECSHMVNNRYVRGLLPSYVKSLV